MRFDSNQAWKQASASVSANRDVLLVLAGVFFLLPGLALALLFPAPEAVPGMEQEKAMEIVSAYYISILPVALPMALFQAVGTLAMLTMLTDRSRPTVGESLKLGLKSLVPYIVSQLILFFALAMAGGILVGITAATGVPAVAAFGMGLAAGLAVYAGVRTSLTGPVIVVEGQSNPVAALKRSWELTRGNFLRILTFFALIVIVIFVLMLIVGLILGSLFTLAFSENTAQVLMTVISSAFNALLFLYFVAVVAAIHRQLRGPPPEVTAEQFD